MSSLFFIALQLDERDVSGSQTLRAALTKASAHPGFTYDLVLGLVRRTEDVGLQGDVSRPLAASKVGGGEFMAFTLLPSATFKSNLASSL